MKGSTKAICSFWRRSIYFLPKLPVSLVEAVFYVAAPCFWPNKIRKGIRIFDPNPETLPHSVRAICGALELIEKNDPRRFERIKREIRIIVRLPAIEPASYSRLTRSCTVDLRRFPLIENPEFELVLLAGLLVHESTHGYLFRRGIMHTQRLFERTERACWKEEVRFASKLGYDLSDFLPSKDKLKDPRLLERFRAIYNSPAGANRLRETGGGD